MDKPDLILELQCLFFEVQDLERYSKKNVVRMVQLIGKYQVVITSLHREMPGAFDNFFRIGLQELTDHLEVLRAASTAQEKKQCFDDLGFYFSEAILDVRRKLKK